MSGEVVSYIANVMTIIGGVAAVIAIFRVGIQQSSARARLNTVNQLIESKQSEVDAVPEDMLGRTRGSDVNQSQLDRLIENAQKPLLIDLRNLERDRRNVLDSLLFFNK